MNFNFNSQYNFSIHFIPLFTCRCNSNSQIPAPTISQTHSVQSLTAALKKLLPTDSGKCVEYKIEPSNPAFLNDSLSNHILFLNIKNETVLYQGVPRGRLGKRVWEFQLISEIKKPAGTQSACYIHNQTSERLISTCIHNHRQMSTSETPSEGQRENKWGMGER